MAALERYPYCCGNCGVTEVGTEAPEGWVYSEIIDAGPLATDVSYWICERCSYDVEG
jgi:hypothetical protein